MIAWGMLAGACTELVMLRWRIRQHMVVRLYAGYYVPAMCAVASTAAGWAVGDVIDGLAGAATAAVTAVAIFTILTALLARPTLDDVVALGRRFMPSRWEPTVPVDS